MADTASVILNLRLMEDGVTSAWGEKVDTNMQIIEGAINGTADVSTTGGDTTLDDADYTDDDGKKAVISVTGALVSNANIIIPNTSRRVFVINNTSGAYTVTVKTSGGAGKAVTQGTAALLHCDGSDNIVFLGAQTVIGTGAPNDASGAAASSVSVTPTGNLAATDAQAALAELQGDIDTINANLASYQPLDTDLTTIAGLANTKGNIMVGSGSAWTSQAVGTDGFALIAKSGATNGVTWAALLEAGTDGIFYQAAAPTGWTGSDADSDKAMRIVSETSGLGGASGGTTAFETVFDDRTIAVGELPDATITITDPGHTHPLTNGTNVRRSSGSSKLNPTGAAGSSTAELTVGSATTGITAAIDNTTRGGAQSAMDFDVQFVSCIKAAKDAY